MSTQVSGNIRIVNPGSSIPQIISRLDLVGMNESGGTKDNKKK